MSALNIKTTFHVNYNGWSVEPENDLIENTLVEVTSKLYDEDGCLTVSKQNFELDEVEISKVLSATIGHAVNLDVTIDTFSS